MIYVSQEQLDQVEYLITQSIQGNHILFDAQTVRSALASPRAMEAEDAYSVEPHIEKLISLEGLASKRAYLERLDEETYERVVRTYFNIVENNLYENNNLRH